MTTNKSLWIFWFPNDRKFFNHLQKSGKIEKKKSLIIFIANFKFFKSSRKKSSFFDAQICSFIRIIWTFMPKNVSFSKPKNAPILKIISIFTKKNWVILIALCILLWLEILVFQFQEFRKIPQNQLRNFFVLFSNLKL